MEQALNYLVIFGTLLCLLLWIGDMLQRRSQRPKPRQFELKDFDNKQARAIEPGKAEKAAPPKARPDVPTEREPVARPSEPALRPAPEAPQPVEPPPAPPVKPEPPVKPAPPVEAPAKAPVEVERSWLERMRAGLSKTRAGFGKNLSQLFSGSQAIDDDLLEELETLLITADVGMSATQEIIASISEKLEKKQLKDAAAVKAALRQELISILEPCAVPLDTSAHKPFMMLVVGVNGVGKTTTIGKLASRYKAENQKVLLAAGDTFRAAAVEQLQVWGERAGVPVVAQHQGADSASVLFDAMQSATAKGFDIAIADTAGRLQNKDELMNELKKVVRVIQKHDASAPHEVLLVVDATTGQNALSQAKLFKEAVSVTGIAVTKLDGTAKGGILFAVARQFGLPIRFIGVGEAVGDLRAFSAEDYVDAMLDTDS
tara:strand:+ start:76062 stop:77351 length:1290 start_codon:yes stop_codon:yes gene_type:complete